VEFQFRMAPGVQEWAARLAGPVQGAWHGRPGSEVRRTLGKIGFWIAQPGLDAAYQRQLVALQRSRRDVADVATARKRLELRIAELERQADQSVDRDRKVTDEGRSNTTEQLAELHRQHADLQAKQERATTVSRRLMAEIDAFRTGAEATKAAYTAAEDAARQVIGPVR
jgi:chromosome segregation ATPase